MKKRNSLAVLTLTGAAVLVLASCGSEPPGHEHQFSELHPQVDPTCSSDGTKAYYTCDGCDLIFNENKDVIDEIETIPATGHDLADGWEVDDDYHWHKCNNDENEKVDKTAHVFDQEIKDSSLLKSPATCESDAVYYKSCVCGVRGNDTDTFTASNTKLGHNYGTPEVVWNGQSATATMTCAREGCDSVISETKDGTFVEDTAATCYSEQKGHYEVTFNNTDLGSASTAANSVSGSAATGNHNYDYANKVVTWNGSSATATATCTTSGCTETVTETKTGTFVKDTNETCTSPEKGHYEVTFDNTNFGTASSDTNTAENGEPHAHTYGELIAKVDRHRNQDGMEAHYVCKECSGFFTEEKVATTADELKIANTYGTFEANTDADYHFDEPISVGEEVVFDFKINESSDKYLKFCLIDTSDGTWDNHTEYITILAGGKGENLPEGVQVKPLLNDSYYRVIIDTANVPCVGTLSQINLMYIWGKNTTASGSFEYNPIGGVELEGESFTSGSWIYMIKDEYDLAGTVSTFDITFLTEGFIKFCFQEQSWGHETKYIQLDHNGIISDFRAGVKVEKILSDIPEGVVSRYRVTIDFNRVNDWAKTDGNLLETVSRLTISPDTTATGTIDINNSTEYETEYSLLVKAGGTAFLDNRYYIEDNIGASFEFKLADTQGSPYLSLIGSGKYIGNFQLTNTGFVQNYQGLTSEVLDDGYVKVTMIYGNINRTNAEWKTIAENEVQDFNGFGIHGSWGTPCDVEIRNFQLINDLSLINRGDKLTFAHPLDLSLVRKLHFEFKVDANNDSDKTTIMFNANTGYVGDYGFKRTGLADNYQGFTCESIGDGFYAVTIEFSKVDRANAAWFSGLGWGSLFEGGITSIISIQTHSSWGQGCPITIRNISTEKSERNPRIFTAAAYVDLPVKYTADQAFGKALTFEYKLTSGGTHSDYAHIVMMNTGWENISGEIDLFGDATCNKGTVEALGDGWYKAVVDVAKFNGDGSDRSAIKDFRLEKFGGDATALTIDWDTLRLVDYNREFTRDQGGVISKFVKPLENWKTSGKQITIDLTGTTTRGGGKFVIGLRNSAGNTVASFTIDFNGTTNDTILYKGNKSATIAGGQIVEGKHFIVTVDLSLLDAESGFDGSETITDINCKEIWYDAMFHSVSLENK